MHYIMTGVTNYGKQSASWMPEYFKLIAICTILSE